MCDYMSKLDRRTPDGSTLALKTLREREAFTRSIITSSPDCIKVLDLDGILLSLLSGNALLGIDDATPLLNTDWLAFWHGDDRTAAEAALQRARAGETSRFVGFFHTFRGEPKWWDVAVSPILDAHGQPEYLLAVSRDITASKHAEDALRASEARMRAFISTSSDAFYRMSPDWLEMRHLDGRNFIADAPLPKIDWRDDYLFDADKAAIWAAIQAAIDSKSHFDLEHRIRRIDGTPGWASSHAIPLFDEHGEIIEWLGTASDITAQREMLEALSRSEERYRTLFSAMDQGYCILDMVFNDQQQAVDYRFLEVNQAFEIQSGMHDVVGKLVSTLIPDLEQYWFDTYGKVALTGEPIRFVNHMQALGGMWFDLYAFRIGGESSRTIAVLFTDITASKTVQNALQDSVKELRASETVLQATQQALSSERVSLDDKVAQLQTANGQLVTAMIAANALAEEIELARTQLVHVAQHDALTNLPNRVLLNDRLVQAMALAQRHGKQLALMFLDLDHFKYINDSLGHSVGDQLLLSVAARLLASVRSSDTVCRQGGDEFVILLADIEHAEDAGISAQKILTALSAPHMIDGLELHISVSIGIGIYPDDAVDPDTLIKNADTAMYHAKENGRNNFQFFKSRMNVLAVERHAIENELRGAIASDAFRLFYQPKIALETGMVSGVEALLRWQHPIHGLIYPEQFVWIAEDSGLIVSIGMWALQRACRDAQAWQAAGAPALAIAVNVSASQFRHPDFIKQLSDILDETGLAPHLLELELTESVLMQDSNTTIAILNSLKALGVRLAIDDFGIGNSSLSYLKRFKIDTLKIDQSFLRDIHPEQADSTDAAIISAVIGLGKSLNLRVVVEGVETAEQLAFLHQQGCSEGQGYYFSRAIPADAVLTILQTDRCFIPTR